MPYKVKATVVEFLGDNDVFPCHMNYKIGDEIIFDGQTVTGHVCAEIFDQLGAKMRALHAAGPRYIDPAFYSLFWYASLSVSDPEMAKYDGAGFKSVLKTMPIPHCHIAKLNPPNSFLWPPKEDRIVVKEATFICPDVRTGVLFKLEAIDLCEFGESAPYFRREMTLMDRIYKAPGSTVESLLNSYTDMQRDEIYPPLSPQIVTYMIEEMELMGYVERKDGKLYATPKARTRLDQFIAEITPEEVEALELK